MLERLINTVYVIDGYFDYYFISIILNTRHAIRAMTAEMFTVVYQG